MMNNISTVGMSRPPPPPPGGSQELTDDQKTNVTEIMNKYDAENLTESDAVEIVSQIKKLGIAPGSGLADSLQEVGFDAKEIGDLAGVAASSNSLDGASGSESRPPPPPPPPSGDSAMTGTVNTEVIMALQTLMDAYGDTDLTEDDWTNLMSELAESGIDISEGLVDVKV